MNEESENNINSLKGEVVFDGMQLTALLFKHKLFIIIFTLVVTGIAILFAYLQPNQYVATVSVVPPKTSSSLFEGSLGNLSSTLKDIGLTKLGGQSDGYTFMVILTSRTLIDSMINIFDLPKRYDISDTLMSLVRDEFVANLEVSIEKAGNYTVSIWDTDRDTAAIMANKYVQLANQKALELSQEEAKANRIYLEERYNSTDSILKAISDTLGIYAGSKMIISPIEQAQAVSGAISDMKAQIIESEVYYELHKRTYGTSDPMTEYYKNLQLELRRQMDDMQKKPGFAGNFALKEAAGIGVQYMKLYIEFETYSKVKAVLLPMLEKARLDERRNSQYLFVVDEAVPADKKDRPKRSVIILGAGFGAFVFACFLVVAVNRYRLYSKKFKALMQKIDN